MSSKSDEKSKAEKPAKKSTDKAASKAGKPESHGFQAEVSRLLDIVAHSLYSNKEIFLRELISNASDACDKLRYEALTEANLLDGDTDLKINLSADPKAKTLTVTDNGIGMSHDELVRDLGTIARSGTAAFLDEMSGDGNKDMNLIGQFGVGFYSVFMIADKVEVTSVKAGTQEGWVWKSDGKGSFTVEEATGGVDGDAADRGTTIKIFLNKEALEYAETARISHIVKTYSDHVALPIILDGEQLNVASALWARQKSEIDETQYKEFYHHVSHGGDEPWMTLHNQVEGVVSYSSLIFIPTMRPFDLFQPERNSRLKLYVRRVFISDDCADLLPSWLRFLRGVIDSEDLPLNVSREMLQDNPVVAKIRAATIKRVLAELKKKAEKAPEEYEVFWDNFGLVMKEGLYEDQDHQEQLLALARFHSTTHSTTGSQDGVSAPWVSLADYVGRMKEGQEHIYYISGESGETVAASPQLEEFKARGIEVLLMTDPIDEFWIATAGAFDGKPFQSATRGAVDFDKISTDDTNDKKDETAPDEKKADTGDIAALSAMIKLALGDAVKDVRASNRLTDSPVCLVADEGDMDIHLERMMRQHQRVDAASARILELNPGHDLIKKMADTVREKGASSGEKMDDYAFLLLDQARIIEGESIPDPVAFSRRLAGVMAGGMAD